VRDFEREEDRATAKRPWTPEPEVERPGSVDGRGLPVNDEQGLDNTDGPQRSRPWGFWLVLTAIVVVAVVYSVTMLTIGREIQTPATAIGAMTAAFAVIGTLVGTYFGIKAGLDGQDKVKDTVDRAVRGAAGRPLDRDRREYE
jgi:hypothetical protein